MAEPIDVSDRANGSVSEWGQYHLSLAGPHSHVLTISPGQGRLVIGPQSMGKKADLHVEPDAVIEWSAFDPFSTPAGSPWPRHIDYQGNDAGFFVWSQQRPIENFRWAPAFSGEPIVDAAGARISGLGVDLTQVDGTLELALPPLVSFSVTGDVGRLRASGPLPNMLGLTPRLGRDKGAYVLPHLGRLAEVRSLAIGGKPMGRPISLAALSQFEQLESLSLWGSFTDWEALATVRGLRNIEIRFVPDLDGIPPLSGWPALDAFIAFNIDEAAGKRLKAEIKAREKVRPWDGYTSVSKLRKPDWWLSEYGRPFSSWNSRMAKAANAAYDAVLVNIDAAKSAADIEAAVVGFVESFNRMKGIETTEREDIGDAVVQLGARPGAEAFGVGEDDALVWFEATRDF